MQADINQHLSYCTNIHTGENWEDTFRSLMENLPKIKKKYTPDTNFGVGLRLSNQASTELGTDHKLAAFKAWLDQNGMYVFTMNGFPYGNFHGVAVKDKVHAPDWTAQQRVEYTQRLFIQLQTLLPKGMEGGISTSPVSYKHWHKGWAKTKEALELGAKNMAKVALQLYQIEQKTGKYLHLDVEPEPDGLLENTGEFLSFFGEFLVPTVQDMFGVLGFTKTQAAKLAKRYITLCYDICHFSLAFEEPEDTFKQLKKQGIRVGKIQISAALKILASGNKESIWEALATFDEPTYLHQVTEKKDGKVNTYPDLPLVLSQKKPFEELRAHFHVPIFLEDFGLLQSTQDHIVKTLAYIKRHPKLTKHLEVETYTWEVLPKTLKIPLVDSVVRELEWVRERL